MPQQHHEWTSADRVGGVVCLDLVNTVGDHAKTRDVERLPDWDALLRWGEWVGVFAAAELPALRKVGTRDPSGAQRTVHALHRFREVLYRVASALAAGRTPAPYDLDQLETAIQAALRSARLVRQERRFVWIIDAPDPPFHLPLFRVALSALDLLQGDELDLLRECRRCSWLFIDRSRSHGRRWCRADTCGNRTRVARHYQSRLKES